MNSSEISAQAAVYHILSIPLSINSRSTVSVNTNRPKDRIFMLKSDETFEKPEPDSKDVFVEGWFDMYLNRLDEMANAGLSDFASLYNMSKKETDYTEIVENSEDEDIVDDEIDDRNTVLKMKHGKGWVKKRTKRKIIRFSYIRTLKIIAESS